MKAVKYEFGFDSIRADTRKPAKETLTVEKLHPLEIMRQAFLKYPLLSPSEIFEITGETLNGLNEQMARALDKDQLDVFDALSESTNFDSAIHSVFRFLAKPKPDEGAIQVRCNRLYERMRVFEQFVSQLNKLGGEFWAGDGDIKHIYIVMQDEARELRDEWYHLVLCEIYEDGFSSSAVN